MYVHLIGESRDLLESSPSKFYLQGYSLKRSREGGSGRGTGVVFRRWNVFAGGTGEGYLLVLLRGPVLNKTGHLGPKVGRRDGGGGYIRDLFLLLGGGRVVTGVCLQIGSDTGTISLRTEWDPKYRTGTQSSTSAKRFRLLLRLP